jgi:hypothetical protein
MIVYNITIKVSPHIEKEWLQWQKQEHIPEIIASGCFTEYKFFRLLEQDDSEGQYFSPTPAGYHNYIDHHAPELRKKAIARWGDKFIAFRTVMEVVN